MQIDYNILIAYGGIARKFEKGSVIFWEGGTPNFFYQVVEGEVKMFSSNHDGKDLIQGIFSAGESFGEPPLLLGRSYPSTAQANKKCVIIRITKERFLNILEDYPEAVAGLLYKFAERIYQKASSVQIWVNQTPEEKIIAFLNKNLPASGSREKRKVPYTRQEIAGFTGLRVETVIRTLLRLSREGKVAIIGHKLYF
ncbi:MAG: Crp/Fnr family transcriptional regulator [Cytophagaceae bacterium SCN 52-12]|nr:MAG: Crp/Fnr family transcriptional regulator [Cytophagaceae bacterium SCN 52-12]